MRLGTCIVLELVVAAGAVGGVWIGVGQAAQLAGEYLGSREAVAATSVRSTAFSIEPPARLPRAILEVSLPEPPPSVFGAPDDELLGPLAGPVTKIKLNHGGTSLSVRLDFAGGGRAAFKPEQIHLQSDPRREIAAYRLDRLLGIGRVSPAKAIAIPLAELLDAAEPSHRRLIEERFADEGVVRKGIVRGEVSWWLPDITFARIDSHLIDDKDGKAAWTSYLQIGATIPEESRALVEQIAQIVLFDVLIDNPDRWTGGNTMMSPDGKVLYFMDNTMSFSRFEVGHESNLLALRRIQVYPRRLVERLRTLTEDQILGALGRGTDEGLAPLIDDREIRAILVRRDNMLRHIDALIAEHGEAAVLALP